MVVAGSGSVKSAIALCCLLLLGAAAAGQQARKFERAASLTVSFANCMAQDRDGLFWIGSNTGIYKWDGRRVQFMNPSNSGFPSLSVYSILVDRRGDLWVATLGNGIVFYDKGKDSYQRFRYDRNDPNTVSSDSVGGEAFCTDVLAEDPEGGIWVVAAGAGVCRISPDRKGVRRYASDAAVPGSLPTNHAISVEASASGDVWVGTDAGLSVLRKGSRLFKTYRHDPADGRSLSDDTVTSILEDSSKRIWIATRNGLNRYEPATDDFDAFGAGPSGLSGDSINVMAEDRAGRLWLGHRTSYGGMSVLDARTGAVERYAKGDGAFDLTGNNVKHIAVGIDGVVWICEGNGYLRYDPDYQPGIDAVDLQKTPDGSLSSLVYCVVQARGSERVIAGMGADNIRVYDAAKRTLERRRVQYGGPIPTFDCGLTEPDGSIWMGGDDGSVYRLDPEFRRIEAAIKVARVSARVLLQDPSDPDLLWMATRGEGVARISKGTGKVVKYRNVPGDAASLASDGIQRAMAFDRDDPRLLYVGTAGSGLDVFDTSSGKAIRHYVHDEKDPKSISNDYCTGMAIAANGDPWITTPNGLNRLDRSSGTFARYGVADGGYAGQVPTVIQEDGAGRLWIGDDALKAIVRFDPSTGSSAVFGKADGMTVGQPGAFGSLKDSDGRLWFPGETGVAFFDPATLKGNEYKPEVVITGLSQGGVGMRLGTAYERAKGIRLPWDKPYFEFEAASLSYSAPEDNRYRFKLEGWDKDWYDAGLDAKGRYSGLRGGDYVLKVMGSNNDGLWSDKSALLRVHVGSPFWLTWWFFSLAGLLATSILAALYSMRARAFKAEAASQLMNKEMELAKRIQTALLPKDTNKHSELEISATMQPAAEVGGDYYDVQEGDSGSIWISIGDVSGHGMTPGLIMMIAQTVFSTIVSEGKSSRVDPVDLVAKVNRQVYANVHERLGSDNFMSFNAIKYSGGGQLSFAGAHLPILVHRASTGSGEEHDTEGTWLNLIPEISGVLVKGEFTLGIGDTMVIYTDGITEAFNEDGEMYGIPRLKECIARNIGRTVEGLRDAVMDAALAWSKGIKADDMTVVAVRRVR